MRRLLVVLVLASVLIPTTAQAKERTGPCTGSRGFVTRDMPPAVQQQKVRWLIACANLQWPVPGGLNAAMYYANRETGNTLNPFSHNPSGASGIYQFMPRTWDSLVASWPIMNRWTGTWVYSARANILRAIRTAHESGWGAWS